MTPPLLLTATTGPGCETLRDGWIREPVSAWTSLAFVVAGLLVWLNATRQGPEGRHRLAWYAALVTAVGVGSVIEHGPDPAWADLAHDVPLIGVLAFVAADSIADLSGRPRRWWWWAAPTLALAPVVVMAPPVGDRAQVVLGAVAVVATLWRAGARPRHRAPVLWAVTLLAVGSAVGTASRAGGPLCDPDSVWQGHGLWHLLAATALLALAPVVGQRTSGAVPT